jgi:hypothetical protein
MMKNRILFAMLTILVMGNSFYSSSAQDKTSAFQGFIVWEDAVYPSALEAYEHATKMMMALYAEQGLPDWIRVYSTNDFIYYWVFPVETYADVDTLYDEFRRIYENAPEKVKAINDAFEGTHEYTKSWTCYWDNGLSYNPEGSTAGMDYFTWRFCWINKGGEDEMREVFKEWAALASSKNIPRGWNTYIGDMGVETPFMFWVSVGKNEAEYYKSRQEIMHLYGAERFQLWKKQMALMRKYEEKSGWYRHDLSYIPEE